MRPPLTRSPVIQSGYAMQTRSKPISQRGIVSSDKEVASRESGCPLIPNVSQPQQDLNFVGYWFNLLTCQFLLTQERWFSNKSYSYQEQGKLQRQAIHVPDMIIYSHGETGLVRLPSRETHTVAPEVTCPRDLGKSYSHICISPPTSRLVVR